MTKLQTLPLFWAASSLLLFNVVPVVAQSRAGGSGDPDTLFNCTWSNAALVPAPILLRQIIEQL